MGFATEAPEVLYAAIVAALILFAKSVHPGFQSWWEESEWDKVITAGACFLTATILWVFTCPLNWLDLPIYQPNCSIEGFLINVPYKAFLAYMFNWSGVEAFNWVRERTKNKALGITVSWLSSFWFWSFLGLVIFEYLLLQSGLSIFVGMAVIVGASLMASALGVITLPSLSPYARALSFNIDYLWWGALFIKVALHIIPLPFWLSPIVSIFFTIVIFIVSNMVFGIKGYDRN